MQHTLKGVIEKDLLRPFHILALEPILVLVTLYLSIGKWPGSKIPDIVPNAMPPFLVTVYVILYATFEAFPLIWEQARGFTPGLSR